MIPIREGNKHGKELELLMDQSLQAMGSHLLKGIRLVGKSAKVAGGKFEDLKLQSLKVQMLGYSTFE